MPQTTAIEGYTIRLKVSMRMHYYGLVKYKQTTSPSLKPFEKTISAYKKNHDLRERFIDSGLLNDSHLDGFLRRTLKDAIEED